MFPLAGSCSNVQVYTNFLLYVVYFSALVAKLLIGHTKKLEYFRTDLIG